MGDGRRSRRVCVSVTRARLWRSACACIPSRGRHSLLLHTRPRTPGQASGRTKKRDLAGNAGA
eukprot:6179418-Pleurochrysis_carterae.AAC.7